MNIMYPKKLIEISTHGKSVSHLIKTMSKEAPVLPKCTPSGIGSIELPLKEDPFNIPCRFRVNGGKITDYYPDEDGDFDESDNELTSALMSILLGITGEGLNHIPIEFCHKFTYPDNNSTYGTPVYVGGVNEDGVVKLFDHDINLENTVVGMPTVDGSDYVYHRIGKAERIPLQVDILPIDGVLSMYDNLMETEFYRNQKLKNPTWVVGQPITTLSCGGFKLNPFIPTKISDVEYGFVAFQAHPRSDADDESVFTNGKIIIDGVPYVIRDLLDSSDGLMINDGVLNISEQGRYNYMITMCCTVNRTQVMIAMENPKVSFSPSHSPEVMSNAMYTSDTKLEACLTPPAIAPFGVTNQTGLYVPYGDDSRLTELWGDISINGISYGRKRFIDGFRDLNDVSIGGIRFQFYYGDDGVFTMTLGDMFGSSEGKVNLNVYYSIEIKFDSDPLYLKPTNVYYGSHRRSVPYYNPNPSGSLDVVTNTFRVFMKYIESVPT